MASITGRTALASLAAFVSLSAQATNGYFAHGYGTKSEAVAGLGIALPQDALAAAANPAGIGFVGERIDLGVSWLKPSRDASITGNQAGADEAYDADRKSSFLIPNLGYNRPLSPDLSFGIVVYGNGGLNTDYTNNPYTRFGATGAAGIDFAQLFVAPTVAYKITARNTLGLAVNLAYQQFSAKGIDAFGPFSSDAAHLTNQGTDRAYGAGVHLGWLGQITDAITLGLTWQPKTKMSRFDKYRGLFANRGEFDIPETYGAGLAVKAIPAFALSADVQRISYSKVAAVGNRVDSLFTGAQLGTANGPGFGWRDVTVYKFGALYQVASDWIVRAGYSYARQPIPENQTLLNILAPAVSDRHLTLGTTWNVNKSYEASLAYSYNYGDTLHGNGSIPTALGGGEADLHFKLSILSFSLGYKF
ncbi:OmpP1/FadL family transporter [Solimonas soli]|uniref:OmpP1/FadL family transporter n=1 Tax=Solimonas soli TaxID=413479 RepID=UPI0004854C8D|nr:outer membrane protein transport protein [Solimonas soli]